MKQRWTYRFYPTPTQERFLARAFGCVRYVYNWGLAARSQAYKDGIRMNYCASSRALTELKHQPETEWLSEIPRTCLQQSLRDLDAAFSAFFSKRARYPQFKKRGGRQTVCFNSGTARVTNGRHLTAPGLGKLHLRWNRNLPSDPSSMMVIREPSGRYFVSFVVDAEVSPLPETGDEVGIDFGSRRLATLSTGEIIPNPRPLRKRLKRLARLQRVMARRQKASKRRNRARIAVARCHERIANTRKDAAHKLAISLVRRFDTIYIEDLNLRGMVKNHNLALSMSDAGIGQAIRVLEQKAKMYGKTVIKIDRWFPSTKTCSDCGYVLPKLSLGAEEWVCPECGAYHDRDHNAAINIMAAGQAVAAQGGEGSGRGRKTAVKPAPMNCEPSHVEKTL